MIKIQDHLKKPDSEDYLLNLAKKHWNNLNKKLANGKRYHKNSIIHKCAHYASQITTTKYKNEYCGNDLAVSNRHADFFNYLTKNNNANLELLIISKPNELYKIRLDILSILQEKDLYVEKNGKHSQTRFGSLLTDDIFNYSAFRSSKKCADLLEEIGFATATCPYCNDSDISLADSFESKNVKAYLDMDHFYPKLFNPFFAVSFFNLIPTCHNCNSGEKRDKQFLTTTHINPYMEALDDHIKFTIPMRALLGVTLDEIKIVCTHNKSQNMIDDLNLINRYQKNKKEIADLVNLFLKYKHYLGGEFGQAFIEMLLNGVPQERSNILSYQRGKMKRDILMQLDSGINALNIR